jgi:Fe-S-cluster-containing hydrogenase component 2
MSQQDFLSLLSWHAGQQKVAAKCDLCFFDEEGPACIRACPHKALRLVEGTNGEHEAAEQMKAVADTRQGGD